MLKFKVHLNEVSVENDRFVRTHGKAPRGAHGRWGFTSKRSGDLNYDDEKEVHIAPHGSLTDAKKSAKAWAKKHGHRQIYTMEHVDEYSINELKLKNTEAAQKLEKEISFHEKNIAKLSSFARSAAPGGDLANIKLNNSRKALARKKEALNKLMYEEMNEETDEDDDTGKNLIVQLRKSISLNGNKEVKFGDGKKVKVNKIHAMSFISKHNNLKKPAEKEAFVANASKSHDHFKKSINEETELDEANLVTPYGKINSTTTGIVLHNEKTGKVKTITYAMLSGGKMKAYAKTHDDMPSAHKELKSNNLSKYKLIKESDDINEDWKSQQTKYTKMAKGLAIEISNLLGKLDQYYDGKYLYRQLEDMKDNIENALESKQERDSSRVGGLA